MVVQSRPKERAMALKEADWSSIDLIVKRSSMDKCLFFLMIVSSWKETSITKEGYRKKCKKEIHPHVCKSNFYRKPGQRWNLNLQMTPTAVLSCGVNGTARRTPSLVIYLNGI